MSHLLLIDTAIQGIAVGLTPLSGEFAGELVWSKIIDVVNDSARLLPLAVDEGLGRCSVAPQNISGIVVTTGPGSFTGLRVGLAYAMGFSAGVEALTGAPMRWLGLSSLGEIADFYFSKNKNESYLVALAATKVAGYAAHRSPQSETKLLPIQTSDDFSNFNASRLIVVGEWNLLEERWRAEGGVLENIKMSYQEAGSLILERYAEIGLQRWPAGFAGSMPAPNYLRKSTVEEKEKEKGNEK